MKKRLYRSSTNKVFGGILGGLGDYFDIDPVLFRVIWVFILVFTGVFPGLLVYIVALFVIPVQPDIVVTVEKE